MTLLLVNAAIFQVGWSSSVIGGAQQKPWLGPLAALIALVVHLRFARKPFEEVMLVILCALIGASFDSVLVAAGWVTYKSGQFSSFLAHRPVIQASGGIHAPLEDAGQAEVGRDEGQDDNGTGAGKPAWHGGGLSC